MPTTEQQKQEVKAIIEQWLDALNALDVDRAKSLWDQSYSQLLYIAEENNDAVVGWPGINDYYNGLADSVETHDATIDNLTVDVLGDVAYAYCTFLGSLKIKGFDHPMVFNERNTFVLRNIGGQWKIIHFHESMSRDRSHETWGFRWQ